MGHIHDFFNRFIFSTLSVLWEGMRQIHDFFNRFIFSTLSVLGEGMVLVSHETIVRGLAVVEKLPNFFDDFFVGRE